MFSVFSHQGSTDQNYTEIPSHPSQKGYFKKTTNAGEIRGWGRERSPYTLLVGM
jgi:hypothetical protein